MPAPTPTDHDASSLLSTLLGAAGLGPVEGQRWLVIDDPAPEASEALAAAGASVTAWHRSAITAQDGAQPTGEPRPGPYHAIALRLPRAREALAWALEAAAAQVAPGGALWVYGPNEEGAKSAGNHLAPWWHSPETLDTRRKCRLWRALRSEAPANGRLADHLRPVTLDAPGGPLHLLAGPGVFAKGELDNGTRLLLAALEQDPTPLRRALDVGCGIGVLGAFLQARHPECTVDAIDADAVSIACVAAGCPTQRAAAGDGLAALVGLRTTHGYDLIVSNPPIHQGKHLDFSVMAELVRGAPARLAPGGRLVLVAQQQRAIGDWLREALPSVKVILEDRQFKVWQARA